MKIKGKITLLINREYSTIELQDDVACTVFAMIKLTPNQLNCALSRQGDVDCEIEIMGLDKLGKKHENKELIFERPTNLSTYEVVTHSPQKLSKIAQDILDKEGNGWIAESYFNSQDSFFKKDGKQYARCTIRRWV